MSLRQVTEHPWETFTKEIEPDAILKGTITRIADFGVFVELAEGVEGLVHISELPENTSKESLARYNPGQELNVRILGMDIANRRMSLSVKAAMEEEIESNIKEHVEKPEGPGKTGQVLGDKFPEELRKESNKLEEQDSKKDD